MINSWLQCYNLKKIVIEEFVLRSTVDDKLMVSMYFTETALNIVLFFVSVAPLAQVSQMQEGPRAQGMVGMEAAEGSKHVLEWHTVTCTNQNTLDVEAEAQGDWAEG